MKRLIIASTSTIHNGHFLEYLLPELKSHFKEVKTLTFVPFARPSGITHEEYTNIVSAVFNKINIQVKGLHEYKDPKKAIEEAEGIFIGGGNTFVLVKQLYALDLIPVIQNSVNKGIPYLGTSAGSNICGLTMETTNDMPIVYPPSFKTLSFVPFNINPHYLDPDPNSTHMGETRETRILEFHAFNSQPVVGIREGSWIEVIGDSITLKGNLNARLFEQGKKPREIPTGFDLSTLN